MSRIALDSIPALTFYKNSLTAARRTSAIAQLICIGKPCALYQPEVVRCRNIGGSGVDVDWKCEADLPSSLRFGKVEVSCEGWSGPGDPYVMKGSCSLEYHLVQLSNALREDAPAWSPFSKLDSFFRGLDRSGVVFMVVWLAVLALIAHTMVRSCLCRKYPATGNTQRVPPPTYYPRPGDDDGSSSRPGSGYFPGGFQAPPPPYTTKDPSAGAGSASDERQQWRPGFFSALRWSQPRAYDWERERERSAPGMTTTTRRRPASVYAERERGGGGSSDLGSLRTSTGYGGSSSR
ncbi:DUF1183-domain-containing protein [Melanogaster broomeanus]|nr:DUF1183-domain-containing protein [Melanogaster broomeanus]